MNDESQIIRLLKVSDEKTIHKLYVDYKSGFQMFANKYPIAKDAVLDIYQDAIVALCENAKKGKLDTLKSSLKTYLFAIGKYMIYSQLKKENKTITYENIEDVQFEWEDIPDDGNEQLNLLRAVFSKLGGQCQQLLKLFYYEEKKLDEITLLLNYENKDVTKSQKSRCLKTLKELTINTIKNG